MPALLHSSVGNNTILYLFLRSEVPSQLPSVGKEAKYRLDVLLQMLPHTITATSSTANEYD